MIERPRYMEWLERWKDEPVIKVITGLRRCGKSSILELFRQHLSAQGVSNDNIVSINFESLDEEYPLKAKPLYDYIVQSLGHGLNYVFLDEVQHVENFERAVDALALRDDVDLYITGSNAHMLSGELATLLTGRYVELRMLPLSFAEFRSAWDEGVSTEVLFMRYLNYGGMPYIVRLNDDESIADYLGGVFSTIIVKDIATRHPRMNMRSFNKTAAFLANNIGNISSQAKISRGLTNDGEKVSATAVAEYVNALLKNYLLFRAERYNIKGREYLETLEKYYLGDLGFRFWLLGKTKQDVGRCLENVVYLELLRRYRSVAIGKIGEREVDFVASDQAGPHYYQVSQTVMESATLERELSALQSIHDDYPKTLLTLDRIGSSDHNGIKQKNVIDWLLEA